LILVTQFREEVKYCRDEKKKLCFAKRLNETCGDSATELRQSKTGPACTNQKGKEMSNATIFLIATSYWDKCEFVGLQKGNMEDAVTKGLDVTEDWVRHDLETPVLKEDQGSDADKLVAVSCSALGSTPRSAWMKFVTMAFSLGCSVLKVCWQLKKCPFVFVVGFVVFIHPLWIFSRSGCDLFRVVYVYEAVTTLLDLLLLGSQWCGKPVDDDEKATGKLMQAFMLVVTAFSLASDIWGFIEGQTCAVLILQIVMFVVHFASLLVRMRLCYFSLCYSSGVSETSVVESSLGFTGYSRGGQPISRF